MKANTSTVVGELKLLLEIWKMLDEPRLRQPPYDAPTIAKGQQNVGHWIEHHLRTLPPPPKAKTR